MVPQRPINGARETILMRLAARMVMHPATGMSVVGPRARPLASSFGARLNGDQAMAPGIALGRALGRGLERATRVASWQARMAGAIGHLHLNRAVGRDRLVM